MKQEENKTEISTLLEIIYEMYKEDIKKGKLRDDTFKEYQQSVGKSARKAKTFQQTEFIFK